MAAAVYSQRSHFDEHILISLILFENVENSSELRRLIRDGQMDCSLLKASVVLDKFQVLVAANKAILARKTNAMTTRKLSTEIIYNMSCSKKISESLVKFGIADNDETVLAVIVDDFEGDQCESLTKTIRGKVGDIVDLPRLANESLIKKIYKIKDPELQVGTLLDAIVCRIATKDFVSF